MTFYTLRLCSGRGAFEAIPRPRLDVDLGHVRRRLEARGVPVVDARVLLIAKFDDEVTVSRDGRVLIKSKDPERALRLLAELQAAVAPALGEPASGGAPPAEKR
ncbi:MAG: hypothetical protein L3K15_01250 [Thermoplasmata archaeon]|nr:hypothetical protein [Thermoplasmata archaeon]